MTQHTTDKNCIRYNEFSANGLAEHMVFMGWCRLASCQLLVDSLILGLEFRTPPFFHEDISHAQEGLLRITI